MDNRTGGAGASDASDEARPSRTIGRRVGLPSGRAVVGALLVTVAVVGLFASYRQSLEETGSSYVVIAATVGAGEVIEDADLAIRTLDIGELGERTLRSKSQAIGAVAVQTLLPGQLLQHANILAPGTATNSTDQLQSFEVSFALDRSRALNGDLVPGEVVDVLATIDHAGESCTTVVAPKARIVSLGGGPGEVLTNRSNVSVTLAIDETDAILGLVFAIDETNVTLVRSTRVQDRTLDGAYCGASVVDDRTEEISE